MLVGSGWVCTQYVHVYDVCTWVHMYSTHMFRELGIVHVLPVPCALNCYSSLLAASK